MSKSGVLWWNILENYEGLNGKSSTVLTVQSYCTLSQCNQLSLKNIPFRNCTEISPLFSYSDVLILINFYCRCKDLYYQNEVEKKSLLICVNIKVYVSPRYSKFGIHDNDEMIHQHGNGKQYIVTCHWLTCAKDFELICINTMLSYNSSTINFSSRYISGYNT